MVPLNHRRPQVLTARSPRPEAGPELWPGAGVIGWCPNFLDMDQYREH
jgi:hypothetical protein